MKLIDELNKYMQEYVKRLEEEYPNEWSQAHDIFLQYIRAKWIVERLDPFWHHFLDFKRDKGFLPRGIIEYSDWLLEIYQKSQTKNS